MVLYCKYKTILLTIHQVKKEGKNVNHIRIRYCSRHRRRHRPAQVDYARGTNRLRRHLREHLFPAALVNDCYSEIDQIHDSTEKTFQWRKEGCISCVREAHTRYSITFSATALFSGQSSILQKKRLSKWIRNRVPNILPS